MEVKETIENSILRKQNMKLKQKSKKSMEICNISLLSQNKPKAQSSLKLYDKDYASNFNLVQNDYTQDDFIKEITSFNNLLNLNTFQKIKNKMTIDKYLNNIETDIQFNKISKYLEYLNNCYKTSTNFRRRNHKFSKSSLVKIKNQLSFNNRNNLITQGQRKSEKPLFKNEHIRNHYKKTYSNSRINKIMQKISSEYNHVSSNVNKFKKNPTKTNFNKTHSISFNYNNFTKNNTATNISFSHKSHTSLNQGKRINGKNIQLTNKSINSKKENIFKVNLDLIFDCILSKKNQNI